MKLTGKEKEEFLWSLRIALEGILFRDEVRNWINSLTDDELGHLVTVMMAIDDMRGITKPTTHQSQNDE